MIPSNPLAEWVYPDIYGDFSDATTWYDGLWGGGQWPPEGFPGLSGLGLVDYLYPDYPGEWWWRMRGLAGLGQTNAADLPITNPTYVQQNFPTVEAATYGTGGAGTYTAPPTTTPMSANTILILGMAAVFGVFVLPSMLKRR